MDTNIPLPDTAQRVAELLQAIGHDRTVVMLPETGKTSAEAAQGLGCHVAAIAKSILFRRLEDDRAVMVVTSGATRVDESKVAALVGAIGKADAKFVKSTRTHTLWIDEPLIFSRHKSQCPTLVA